MFSLGPCSMDVMWGWSHGRQTHSRAHHSALYALIRLCASLGAPLGSSLGSFVSSMGECSRALDAATHQPSLSLPAIRSWETGARALSRGDMTNERIK